MKLTGNELRKKFLQFFATKGHLILPSSSLIPQDDPTLLLIGAGMAPFKPFFTGKMKPPQTRIATSQKCVRTGDIENVGRTARHHTFFEMLGNFSFGDYFKHDAINWAWEFLTKELNLAPERLYVTIHTTDDEAYDIWHDEIGLPPEKIIRMEDNFWEIGPGPCGPCSEIFVDLGPDRGCGSPDCKVGCDCDRYLEIWNLVFTQFDRDEAGNYEPLAKKNIDTGMGLERIASVLQNKKSNFETDLIFPIIEQAAKLANVVYGQSVKTDISLKIIADHVRGMTFMIADGVLPSNEGRGYVLRRILRRAIRHGRLLGIEQKFLAELIDTVVAMYAEPYPDLTEKRAYIIKVVQMEEQRFHETLAQGMELLAKQIADLEQSGKKVLDGATAFKLYDTFGFPWELTQEILEEHAIELDKAAFDREMDEQRERARAARQDNEERVVLPDLSGVVTEELAYDCNAKNAKLVLAFKDGQIIEAAHDGQEVGLILNVTPFYAEGGGQVGDTGVITGPVGKIQVINTKKLPDGTIYHLGNVIEGSLKVGDAVKVAVDEERRQAAARNHTATHLLQAALQRVLGSHVNQAGSSVGADRLRFDFSHFAPVTPAELEQVEDMVNEVILRDIRVGIIETSMTTAKEMGAMALFGEKYGDQVRVVIVDEFSKELCGGTHVANTAQIGLFKIISESGVGSGLRRIEAVTGHPAREYVKNQDAIIAQAASLLKARPADLVARVENLISRTKELEHELGAAQQQLAKDEVASLLAKQVAVGNVQVVAGKVSAPDMDSLRSMADMIRDRLTCGVVVLGSANEGKVNLVAMATKVAVAHGVHAGNIVKAAAKVTGGGGGGRPDMAQAGGKQPEKLVEAFTAAIDVVKQQLK